MTSLEDTFAEVERLTVRPQFLFVRGGISERRKSLVIQARMRRGEGAQTPVIGKGFTATKKVGNAVIRNTARRRLKAAAREVGSIQIQNAATVAGNLCNASPAADGVPPLLTLDTRVELASAGHLLVP